MGRGQNTTIAAGWSQLGVGRRGTRFRPLPLTIINQLNSQLRHWQLVEASLPAHEADHFALLIAELRPEYREELSLATDNFWAEESFLAAVESAFRTIHTMPEVFFSVGDAADYEGIGHHDFFASPYLVDRRQLHRLQTTLQQLLSDSAS